MIISSSIMVRSSPPTRYITQSGVVGWDGAGDGRGGDGGDNSGDDDDGDSSAGGDSSGDGDSVVKAPTALQAL